MTPAEKAFKKSSAALQTARNRALVEHATKKLSTYCDLLTHAGHLKETLEYVYPPEQLARAVTRQDIFDYYSIFERRLEAKRDGIGEVFKAEFIPHEYEGIKFPPDGIITDVPPVPIPQPTDEDDNSPLKEHERLPDSATRLCRLFPFQERAAVDLLYGVLNKNYRAMLLRAAVGVGKTYIIAAVIDILRNMKFCEGKTFSPWPVVYITKASILEQTERVLRDQFGLDTVRDVKVINIEQLRAQFGELMVRCETVVYNGEEQLVWKWREGLHPILFLLDECQVLKNDDSQQSQIVQAVAELKHPDIHLIFFSATPFLRVIDTKCFVLNARIETIGIAI